MSNGFEIERYFDEELASEFSSGIAKPSGISVVGSRFEDPTAGEIIEALDQAEEVGALSVFTAEAGRDYYRLWAAVQGMYDHSDDIDCDIDPGERVAELEESLALTNPPNLVVEKLEQGGFLVYGLSDDPEVNGRLEIDFTSHISEEAKEHAIVQAAFLGTKLPKDVDPIRLPMECDADFAGLVDLEIAAMDAFDSGLINIDQYNALKKALAIIKLNREDMEGIVEFEASDERLYDDAVFIFPQTNRYG